METIWKFPLRVDDKQTVQMPKGAIVLDVQEQHGQPCIWARVVPDAPKVERIFITHGTGYRVSSEAGEYVGSYQMHGGSLVFHVFESNASAA